MLTMQDKAAIIQALRDPALRAEILRILRR